MTHTWDLFQHKSFDQNCNYLNRKVTSTLRRRWSSSFTTSSTPTNPMCKLILTMTIPHTAGGQHRQQQQTQRYVKSNWYIRLNIRPLKQQFQGFNAGDVYLGRDSCTGYESGDYIIFSEEYNSCLTDKSTSSDAVIYTNTIVYALHDPDHRFIIRDYRFKVKVECDMSKREHGVDTIKHNHGHEDHTAAGTGHFSIHLNFYSDSNYQNRFNGFPPAYVVGDVVYVKVQTSMHDYDVKMRLSDCYTKPSEHASTVYTYYLIQNGCPVDRNTYITSQSTHETRFHFQDFEYAGHPDSMFVHCNATFCKSNDYSSECEPQCKHSKRIGHHRSAVQNLNGPIEIAEVETKILFTEKRGKFLYYEMFKVHCIYFEVFQMDIEEEIVKHSSENIQEVLLSKLEQTKNQYSIDLGLRRQESLICCQSCLDKEKPAFYGCKECDKYMCEQCNAKT
ncbi:unnamed protein product [Mytilus edulis]|uniref:ZP domain-containing protein n=1 Tax=Mytilus edulis TaxID=6550 RepID=A0A8S3V2R5_MYTED|nr:unnamed protein product [Mytilus edulis]